MSIFDDEELGFGKSNYGCAHAHIQTDYLGRPYGRPPQKRTIATVVELREGNRADQVIRPWQSSVLDFDFKPRSIRILNPDLGASLIYILGERLDKPLGAWVYGSPIPIPFEAPTSFLGTTLRIDFLRNNSESYCDGIALYGDRS